MNKVTPDNSFFRSSTNQAETVTQDEIVKAVSEAGLAGLGGLRGEKGDNGADGVDGSAGIDGARGISGAQGIAGDPSTDDQRLQYVAGTRILSISGGNTIDLSSLEDNTDGLAALSCAAGQVAQYNGTIWVCGNVSGVNTDNQSLSLLANNLSISGGNSITLAGYLDNTDAQALSLSGNSLSLVNGGSVSLVSFVDTYTAGDGLSVSAKSFSINSPTCSGTTKLQWNDTAFVCTADVDTNTTYTAGTGLGLASTTFNLSDTAVTPGTYNNLTVDQQGRVTSASNTTYLTAETDGVVGNEVLNATSTKGLVRSGSGTSGDPYTLGLINCANNEILKYILASSTWACATDVDTDTNTTYSAGTGISFAGTVISSTLGTSIQDAEVDDNITISSSGSVADGALSSNVSLLGNSIESSEITNGTITFADFNQNGCSTNQVIKWGGSAWACADDADTIYSAGTGISFAGTVISSTLGTSIDSAEIVDGTIVSGDIATDTILASNIAAGGVATSEILDGTILFADIASNSCTAGQIFKYAGSAWSCGSDTDTTYSAGTGIGLAGTVISSSLGVSVDTSEIVDATILFADFASNSCTSGQIIKYNGSAWACETDDTASVAANSLNFTEFADALSLDAATAISLGTNNLALNLNGTGSFAVLNASSLDLFKIDSVTGSVSVGSIVSNAANTLLVLDGVSGSDPTGISGSLYYNTTQQKFRCYQNSAWVDCTLGEGLVKKAATQVATSNSVVFQNVTDMSVPLEANSSYSFEVSFIVDVSNITADFKYTLTAPTGSMLSAVGYSTTGTTGSVFCTLVLSTGTSCPVATATINRTIVSIKGTVANAATAGNLQLAFAQNVATVAVSPSGLSNSTIRFIKL